MLLLPRADATAVTNTAAPALTTVVATAAADATLLLPFVPLPSWRESSHSPPASPGPDLVSIEVLKDIKKNITANSEKWILFLVGFLCLSPIVWY